MNGQLKHPFLYVFTHNSTQFPLIFVSYLFRIFQFNLTTMYKVSSMQIPDEQIVLHNIIQSIPIKQSSKKFLKDLSDDSSISESDLNHNQTQILNQKMQKIDLSQKAQRDQENIKNQKRKSTHRKKKKTMSNINKQQKKEKFNCRFYMQGSCKNGTKCKFTHPVEFSPNLNQPTKPKQKKLESYSNNKKQSNSEMKEDVQTTTKYTRDIYFEMMIDTMKEACYSCKNRQILMTLSCGCHTICESCVKQKMACSKDNHLYDNKVYIK